MGVPVFRHVSPFRMSCLMLTRDLIPAQQKSEQLAGIIHIRYNKHDKQLSCLMLYHTDGA